MGEDEGNVVGREEEGVCRRMRGDVVRRGGRRDVEGWGGEHAYKR
jgi:hypothetical protein